MSEPLRYAFFGPTGTFTEDALLQYVEAQHPGAQVDAVAYESVPAALDAVRTGAALAAMVPFENSVEGSVNVTLDELASGEHLVIVREVVLPIAFSLMVRPGTAIGDIRTTSSHPHALPQFRRWFETNLPSAEWHPSSSNAQAAADVAAGRFDAAFASPRSADLYGLQVVAEGIHDTEGAETRFVLVGRPGSATAPTGADKTSLVLYIGEDHPGALLQILTELAVRGVNLTRIESRPTGGRLGSYCFSVDAEGHIDDARVREALIGLHRVCKDVRFLGSYPKADNQAPLLRLGVSDAEFAEAQAWLDRVRRGEV
jgi:prephenate dehydratase